MGLFRQHLSAGKASSPQEQTLSKFTAVLLLRCIKLSKKSFCSKIDQGPIWGKVKDKQWRRWYDINSAFLDRYLRLVANSPCGHLSVLAIKVFLFSVNVLQRVSPGIYKFSQSQQHRSMHPKCCSALLYNASSCASYLLKAAYEVQQETKTISGRILLTILNPIRTMQSFPGSSLNDHETFWSP